MKTMSSNNHPKKMTKHEFDLFVTVNLMEDAIETIR